MLNPFQILQPAYTLYLLDADIDDDDSVGTKQYKNKEHQRLSNRFL